MPLRAWVNGQETFAFDLQPEQWAALKKDKKAVIRLPCCDAVGHCRTSKLGTQHFYHGHNAHCGSEGETEEHLRAKQIITLAARNAGWHASTEVPGDGWRADVLCTKGTVRVAFEVQWSRQTAERTKERTALYDANGVRVCWLFKPNMIPEDLYYRPSKEVPAFQLPNDPDALRTLVTQLLSGVWKFKMYECDTRTVMYTGVFKIGSCAECHTEFEYLAFIESRDYRPLPEYVAHELHTAYGTNKLNRRPLAFLRRELAQANQECPKCGFMAWRQRLFEEQHKYPWHRLTLEVEELASTPHPHWCNDPLCCKTEDAGFVRAVKKKFITRYSQWETQP